MSYSRAPFFKDYFTISTTTKFLSAYYFNVLKVLAVVVKFKAEPHNADELFKF